MSDLSEEFSMSKFAGSAHMLDAMREEIVRLRAELAARSTPKQGEAVACVSRSNDMEGLVQWATTRVPVGTMLYASPPLQQVEPGWVRVPAKPTPEMCQAGQWKAKEWPTFPLRISPIYQAMLAAAPKEPKP